MNIILRACYKLLPTSILLSSIPFVPLNHGSRSSGSCECTACIKGAYNGRLVVITSPRYTLANI